MGCSNSKTIEDGKLHTLSRKIVNVTRDIYLNESHIKELLNLRIIQKYEFIKYFLINKFWLEDYKKFFEYTELVHILEDEDEIQKSKNNEKKIEISRHQKIISLIMNIMEKSDISLIKDNNRIKNNFVIINRGRAIFPDINTTLLKEDILYRMIDIIKDIEKNKEKNEINILPNLANILIANKNIYIKMEHNNLFKKIDINKFLLIFFLEGNKLRTKYSFYFNEEKNFKEIINYFIKRNFLENYIIKNKYDIYQVNEQKLIINKKEIGIFFNLIKNNEDEKKNKNYNRNNNSKKATDITINNSIYKIFNDNKKEKELINDEDSKNDFNLIKENESFSIISNDEDKIQNMNNNYKKINCSYININLNEYNNNQNNINNLNSPNNRNEYNSQNNNNQQDKQIRNSNNIINININNSNNINNQSGINYNIIINSNNNNIFNINHIKKGEYSLMKRIKKIALNFAINEFLQSLANINTIKQFFIENENRIKECGNYATFSERFINTLKFIYNIDNNPSKLLDEELLKKNNYNNSDNNITSFIKFLFDKFEEELKNLKSINGENINDILSGEKYINYECNICKQIISEKEEFYYLELNLNKIFDYFKKKNKHIKSIKLRDCFNYNKNNYGDYVCKSCQNKSLKNYKCHITKLPEIFILVFTHGEIPLINKSHFYSNYILEDEDGKKGYELTSQINIKENKEYVTFLKSNNQWFICQESDIVNYEENKFEKGVPYISIYQKVDDLPQEKVIDELDRTIDEEDTIDLIFYSTVSKIKEKLDNLEKDMTIEKVYNELCRKYSFENRTILLFNNSRKLEAKKTIKDYNLANNDLIIIVEYNFLNQL